MTELTFVRTDLGIYPAGRETEEYVSKMKYGEQISADFHKRRNVKFHRKFFAMLNVAFDMWQPGDLTTKYGVVEKNFNQFRSDLIILSGYYSQVFRTDGSVKIKAKSISFSSMDEDEFEKVYSQVLDVVLQKICPTVPKEELEHSIDMAMGFA